jgi:hypothetical protein
MPVITAILQCGHMSKIRENKVQWKSCCNYQQMAVNYGKICPDKSCDPKNYFPMQLKLQDMVVLWKTVLSLLGYPLEFSKFWKIDIKGGVSNYWTFYCFINLNKTQDRLKPKVHSFIPQHLRWGGHDEFLKERFVKERPIPKATYCDQL